MRRIWTGAGCSKNVKKIHVLKQEATFPAIWAIISFSVGILPHGVKSKKW